MKNKTARRKWDEIVIDELGKKIIGCIEEREIVYTFMLGRLVKNAKPTSFNLLLKGLPTTGKDWIVKCVSEIFPEKHIEYFGRATPKAFNYIHDKKEEPTFTYDGKVVYLEEITEPTLNGEVILVWTSGKNRMAGVEKGKGIIKETDGKPSIIATSFKSTPSEEIRDRFGILYIELTQTQKRAIKKQRSIVAKDGFEQDYSDKAKEEHAGLECYSVRIPFALKINKYIPDNIRGGARSVDRIYDIIKAVAVRNQNNSKVKSSGMISADEEDYEIARPIIANLDFGFPNFLLSDTQNKIVEVLEKQKQTLSAQEILDQTGLPISIQNFRPHLDRLIDLKKVEGIPSWNEKHYNILKYQLIKEDEEVRKIELPSFEDL